MKKTLNINLGGYPFTIDEDAYRLLKDYLDTIRYAFDTQEDTEDLASDIESRIAEILIEKEGGGIRIVSSQEITEVIERIGKPSEFIDLDETIQSHGPVMEEEIKVEEKVTPPPYTPGQQTANPRRKVLFRDPQNAMLGGVCAGLAAYLNCDPTIIRLITVVLFFLSASTVAIAYIILWIVVPEARTPLQRMQMSGKDTTMENIGKTVTENFREEEGLSPSNQTPGQSPFWRSISKIISVLAKIVGIIGMIIIVPILLILISIFVICIIVTIIVLIALLCQGVFGDSFISTFHPSAPGGGTMLFHLFLAVVGVLLTLGIPLWLLLRGRFRVKNTYTTMTNRRSLLILWLAGIALTAVFTVKTVKDVKRLNRYYDWDSETEQLKNLNTLEEKDIEEIEIHKDGVTLQTTDGNKYEIAKGKVTVSEASSEITSDSVSTDTLVLTSEIVVDSLTNTQPINTTQDDNRP